MPDAVLDPNVLADVLVGVVDNVRRAIHSALGTRPFKVEIVTRRWSGPEVGLGTPTDYITELSPRPKVDWTPSSRMGPGGIEDTGHCTLTGVSLSYTQDELQPRRVPGSETVYRISEGHGQGQLPQFYTVVGQPVPRRGDGDGGTDWKIVLEQVQALSSIDGSDT